MNALATATALPDLHITRTFAAPRDLVFRCWTEPEHLAKWWGPHMFSNRNVAVDANAGGGISLEMVAPDGTGAGACIGTFREVTPPEKLVFTSNVPDPSGGNLIETLVTATFSEANGKTTLKLNARVLSVKPAFAEALAGMEEGWNQSLERLGDRLTFLAEPVIITTRFFRAPRDLVWQVWTQPEHVARWWGFRNTKNRVVEYDVRPGGKWRIETETPDLPTMVFLGEFLAVDRPQSLAQTFGVEGMYEDTAVVETLTLSEAGNNVTRARILTRLDTFEARDGMLASGMEEGANVSYEKMAEIMAELQAGKS